jgi:tRNA1(Val) A37 N6-methylase TrmN6
MQFWTPERCTTLSTEILLAELVEAGAQAARTNIKLYRNKVEARISMIKTELTNRAA